VAIRTLSRSWITCHVGVREQHGIDAGRGGSSSSSLLEVDRARKLLYWSYVRVRILKPSAGVIDGISLGTLMPGLTYDLPHELALRLIIERVAREDLTPVVLIPIGYDENDAELIDHVTRGIRVTRALSAATEEPVRGPPKTKR
jgi:hypothetical protein